MSRLKIHIVTLTDAERAQLTGITKNHRYSQRERNRARILLLSEQGQTDIQVAEQVGCSWMTVRNVRLRFCLAGTDAGAGAVTAKQRVKRAEQKSRAPRVFDGEKEAHLVALACSAPPEGAERWTLRLLKDRLIEMQVVDRVGTETIRRTLKKMNSSRG